MSDSDNMKAQFKSDIKTAGQRVGWTELILNLGMRLGHSLDLFVHLFSSF